MPNITIYLNDDNYKKYRELSEVNVKKLKDDFCEKLERMK